MKKIFLLIIAISFCYTLFSQNQWNQIHPYPTLKNLHDVHFNTEEEGWITGNDELGSSIMYTNDAGVTWETQLSGWGTPSTSLFFIDENEGWAGGWKCIYHTTDKGNTWESQTLPNIYSIIEDVFFIDQTNGWAVGERNTILKTTDGGESWNIIHYSFGSDIRFYGVCFHNELVGFAVGGRSYDDYGIIMKTNDGGETWVDNSPTNCYGLSAITFVDTITGWICGYGGATGQPAELYKTTDCGQTWIKQETDNYTRFNDIYFVDQDNGMILDESMRVFVTTNGGISWDSVYYTKSRNMRKLSFWDNLGCYSVGYTGRIDKSTDMGQSWESVGRQSIGSTISNIGFFDSFNGLALTGYHHYRTVNGGYSWELDTLINNGAFYLLHIVGSSGYMLNTNSQLMKTTNGGEDWVLLDAPQNYSYYKDMQFVNENTGYLCGNYGVLKKTIDGGITWEDKTLSSNRDFISLQFINEDLGWMIDINNKSLLLTKNGGDTWVDARLSNVNSMFYLNENIGYVTTFDSKLFKTVDAGSSWLEIYDFVNSDGFVFFTDELVGWYIAGSSIYHTYDGGISWQDKKSFPYTSIKDIFFLDNNQGWLAGDVGFVATCDFTVNIDEGIVSLPAISVFPNPVYDYVTIKQDSDHGSIIDIKLFNIQGQEIMHFPYLTEPSSFKFNTSSLQSGMYFIEVTTEHNEQRIKLIVK